MRKLRFSKFPPVLFGQGCRLTIGCLAGERLEGGSSWGFLERGVLLGWVLSFCPPWDQHRLGFGQPVGKEFLAKNLPGARRYRGQLKCSLAVDGGIREEQDRASGLLPIRLIHCTGSELYCFAGGNW